jgi:hypothetical protein
MKKAKPAKKKVGRPEGRKPLLNLRVDQSLHDRLTAAAAKAGRTISEETVARIARTFADEEYYDTDARRIGAMMLSAFWFAGHQTAAGDGHKDWTTKEWMQDQACYRAGLLKVAVALIDGMPIATPEEKALTIEAIRGRVATGLVRSGELKFKFEGDA